MNEKMLLAAELAWAEHERNGFCMSADGKRRLRAAILAFLDAAAGDEGVVEKMARAMLADELKSKPRADFDAIWPEEDLIWLSNARAALAALKGDAP